MTRRHLVMLLLGLLTLVLLACANMSLFGENATPTIAPTDIPPTQGLTPTPKVTTLTTPLPQSPVQSGAANPNEPVFISGEIPFTSRFFLSNIAEPYVLLEDEAGFIRRDPEFVFPLTGQVIGPVAFVDDSTLRYSLSLPAVPQGTLVDVDNDGESDTGVQVFAVAYWANVWGDPFLEQRDGMGWSTAYTSAIVDPERDYEIMGGILIVWAPDDAQAFPVNFGNDGRLFTEDDPTAPIPAGYNIVDLDQKPFLFYKEAQPHINLVEGSTQVNDYANMTYEAAFNALFQKVSREYPFTEHKQIDWEKLYAEFAPRVAEVQDDVTFYRIIRDFIFSIPDGHVGGLFNQEVFYAERAGGFGLILAELSDGQIIVTDVLPNTAAADAGIEAGALLMSWNGQPVGDVIATIDPQFSYSYSTPHTRRLAQVLLLTHVPPDTEVDLTFRNPGRSVRTVTLKAEIEYQSLLEVINPDGDALNLPVEARMVGNNRLGYIQLNSFNDDLNLSARLWERHITQLIDQNIAGLIVDLRDNSGGSLGLALDFAGYFYDEEVMFSQRLYYNEISGEFESLPIPVLIRPAPQNYEGQLAILVGPSCASACEALAYALSLHEGAIVVGHYPSAGTYGEVGRGQYRLPGGINLQFPTGREETLDGQILLEGVGVVPDVLVPVTLKSALGERDTVLDAAIEALLELIGE